jgi:hypothetical protein
MSGGGEVPLDQNSPPSSPPLAVYAANNERYSSMPMKNTKASREGAAYLTITEECERLFCDTLKAVFLGEGNLALQESLVMDMQNYGLNGRDYFGSTKELGRQTSRHDHQASVTDWLEIWDYVGGATFRGYITEHQGERSMFVFFDSGVLSSDLKPGCVEQYFNAQTMRLTDLQTYGSARALRNPRL